MGRGGTPAREISFVSLVAYGPNSDSALTMGSWGVTASETRQGGSQQLHKWYLIKIKISPQLKKRALEGKRTNNMRKHITNDISDKGLISKI